MAVTCYGMFMKNKTTPTAPTCPTCGNPDLGTHDLVNCVRYVATRLASLEAVVKQMGPPFVRNAVAACTKSSLCGFRNGHDGNCTMELPALPPTAEPARCEPAQSTYETLRLALADPGYRIAWTSTIAMVLHDRHGITGKTERNAAAEDIINAIFPAPNPAPESTPDVPGVRHEHPAPYRHDCHVRSEAMPAEQEGREAVARLGIDIPVWADEIRAKVAESKQVVDDPFLDATDGAHPAWWRGHDYAAPKIAALIEGALVGKKQVIHPGPLADALAKVAALAEKKQPIPPRPEAPRCSCVFSEYGGRVKDERGCPVHAVPPLPDGQGPVTHVRAYRAMQEAADPIGRHNGCVEILRRYIREAEARDKAQADEIERLKERCRYWCNDACEEYIEAERLRAELAALKQPVPVAAGDAGATENERNVVYAEDLRRTLTQTNVPSIHVSRETMEYLLAAEQLGRASRDGRIAELEAQLADDEALIGSKMEEGMMAAVSPAISEWLHLDPGTRRRVVGVLAEETYKLRIPNNISRGVHQPYINAIHVAARALEALASDAGKDGA